MRLGLNILYLIPGKVGGTETYARELIPALDGNLSSGDELIIYCSRECANLFLGLKNTRVVVLPFRAVSRPIRLLFEQIVLPILLVYHKVDTVFSLGYSSPWLAPCRSVVTIHDLNWYYHPEDFSPFSRLIWKWMTIYSAKFSSHIITDSQSSKRSIVTHLNLPATKVTTILHAAPRKISLTLEEVNDRLKKLNITSPYIATTLAGYPHKNLLTLIAVFDKLSIKFPKLTLVVCGLRGKADQSVHNFVHKKNLEKRIKILGYIEREDLVAVYSRCQAFVFPSAYEGFGYPPLEAMSYGAAVVSSNAFSLKEVVGDGGILVKPYDVGAYYKAISTILSSVDVKHNLTKKGRQRLKKLSWSTTAVRSLAICKTI